MLDRFRSPQFSRSSCFGLARFIGAVALIWMGGCGGDDAPTTCEINLQLSGAVTWQSSSDPACLIPFGSGTGISMNFAPLEGDVESIQLDVGEVKEGQTGAYPAEVEIRLRAGGRWKTAANGCTVNIEEQTFDTQDQFRKRYLTRGSGSCAAAAMSTVAGGGTITLSPFTFRSPASF